MGKFDIMTWTYVDDEPSRISTLLTNVLNFSKNALPGLVSKAAGFGVTAILNAFIPDEKEKCLEEIRNAIVEINKKITDGFNDVTKQLDQLEKNIDKNFKDMIQLFEKSQIIAASEKIKSWYHCINDNQKEVASIDCVDIETNLGIICNGLLDEDSEGYLDKLTLCLKTGFQSNQYANNQLLNAAQILEIRFGKMLANAVIAIVLIEMHMISKGETLYAKNRAERFISDSFIPLLEKYQWCVEELVLDALKKTPTKNDKNDADIWRDLINCIFFVFKKADKFTLSTMSDTIGKELPLAFITGRVIGTSWDIQRMKLRLESLVKLSGSGTTSKMPHEKTLFQSYECTEIRHSCMKVVDMKTTENSMSLPLVMVENEDSDVVILRYRICGFEQKYINVVDDQEIPSQGSEAEQLRGFPSIDQIGISFSIWDKKFSPFASDKSTKNPEINSVRHRAELAIALPCQTIEVQQPSGLPWQLINCKGPIWVGQVANKVRSEWNRRNSGIVLDKSKEFKPTTETASISWYDYKASNTDSILNSISVIGVPKPEFSNFEEQWIVLSCKSGFIYWDNDKLLHADGSVESWVPAVSTMQTVNGIKSESARRTLFRIVRTEWGTVKLQTIDDAFVMVDTNNKVTLSSNNGTEFWLNILEGGQIQLKTPNMNWIFVAPPSGAQLPHATMHATVSKPVVLAGADCPDGYNSFTVHFVETLASPYPFWKEYSMLDSWHRCTGFFYSNGMGGTYSEKSQVWDCELMVREKIEGTLGFLSSASTPIAKLKIEVWTLRYLISGLLYTRLPMQLKPVQNSIEIKAGVSSSQGIAPSDAEMLTIVDVKKEESTIDNGVSGELVYSSGTVEVKPGDTVWLRIKTRISREAWTHSWATTNVRVKDLRLSWVE